MACEVKGEQNAMLLKLVGTPLHGKMSTWLKSLRWVQSPALPVTCVELALDFEAFSGSRLPGETLAEKGVQIGALMRAFNDIGLLHDRPRLLAAGGKAFAPSDVLGLLLWRGSPTALSLLVNL